MIKALGFDWLGVIYGKPGSVFNVEVCALLGISKEKFLNVYFKHNHKLNVDGMPIQEFWGIILHELGKDDLMPKMMDYLNSQKGGFNESLVVLIRKLNAKGYKIGLLSNASHETGENIKKSEVAKYFSSILISADEGVMKPEEDSFKLLAMSLSVELSELVFIDDVAKNLVPAEKLGFYGIQFTTTEKLIIDLGQIGVNTKLADII